jgi:hypothetical protein
LSVGNYEVRAEGDGAVSEVKKGVAVTENGATEAQFAMLPGKRGQSGSTTARIRGLGMTFPSD